MGEWGVGSPNCLLLDHWALLVHAIFDEEPYLVGSATYSSTWRDVDVRVILDDERFDAIFGTSWGTHRVHGAKWSALMAAISVWGQKVTGLPIDFQVQRRGTIKEADWKKRRMPLGMFAREGDLPLLVITPREPKAEEAKPTLSVSSRRAKGRGPVSEPSS